MKFRDLIESSSKKTYEWKIDLEPGDFKGVSYVKDKRKVDKLIREYKKAWKAIDPDDLGDDEDEDDYYAAYEDLIVEYEKKFKKLTTTLY